MAQPQRNIHVAAPAFAGLNTQDSPVGLGLEYANIADNCVIDRYGRIACRNGFNGFTQNPSVLAGEPVVANFVFQADSGVDYLLAAGANKLWLQQDDGTLLELTLPVGYPGITDDNWQFAQLNNVCYMVQKNHPPLKFEPATPTQVLEWTEEPSQITGLSPAIGYPDCITAGYGRIFCGSFDAEKSILSWSNLLDGDGYTTTTDPASDSGFFDLEEYWPYGYDETVSIRVHNNFLVVWGKVSILLYNIPDTGPVDGVLSDTIEGIGCAARDTVQPTGHDVFFLDYTGVRSLSRTIQEKSVPIGDISINIQNDVQLALATTQNDTIRAVYDPDNSLYAVFFPEGAFGEAYVFDTRTQLQNGGLRPTRWPGLRIFSAGRAPDGGTWYTGTNGFYAYEGYDDTYIDPADDTTRISQSIPMVYQTHPQTFDEPVNLKFPKQVDVTVIGGQAFELCLSWSYDYSLSLDGYCRFFDRGTGSQYNIDEYGVAEYSGAFSLLSTEQFNVWGNGRNVRYQFDAKVTGSQLSFQEINIQALTGRII